MVEESKYQEILDSGLSLDHYFLLCNIKNGVKPIENKRIQGFLNLLIKKGYIDNDELTEKGIDLVQNCEFSEIIEVPTIVSGKDVKVEMDLGSWILKVHKACEDRIFALTGKKQIKDKIEKKTWTFLCNPTDLGKNLQKVIAIYKLTDYDKIERTLLKHIDNCHSANSWFPIMYYYIIKFGKSDMVTDMDSIDDEESDYSSGHKLM